MGIERDSVGPGQESVWDYPRPPRLEPAGRPVRIEHRGLVIVDTRRALRLLETSHPPTYYIPRADVAEGVLRAAEGSSWCEWKGAAGYFDVVVEGSVLPKVAWSYTAPMAPYAELRDHLAFYAAPFDLCLVDGVAAVPQPGGFYGGWVSPWVRGPFKGGAGSRFW